MVFKRPSYQFRHKKIVVPVDDPPSASSIFRLYSQGSMAVIRGGWPRLIMHTPRDDVITAIEQDGRDRLEVIFKQLGLPGKATAV